MKTSLKRILCPVLLLTGLLAATAQTLQSQVLFSFTRGTANPQANLVQGPAGSFYGTTSEGAISSSGTVFKVTTNGRRPGSSRSSVPTGRVRLRVWRWAAMAVSTARLSVAAAMV